ncbi:MAG: hypothetical protein ACREM2_08905 [Vulcanimicrobiaceae bacterium]
MRILRFTLAIVLLASLPALAQNTPGDTGAGLRRGMQQLNNSGQAGTVTLFRKGARTLVVVALFSVPQGRMEPSAIYRGRACDAFEEAPAYNLAPLVNGISQTLVLAPEEQLASGNYLVAVRAGSRQRGYVACGHLFR